MLISSQRGFTLIEVLISGFILFLVLSSMTAVYKGAILTSGKAEEALQISSIVPSVRMIISDSFEGRKEPEQTGEGKYGEFDYHWMATLTHEGQPSRVVQEDSVKELRYTLWRVQLTIKKDDLVRRYHFNELAW